MKNSVLDSPVMIIGGGPAGLAMALSLARLDIESTIFEKRITPSNHPRAHWVNTRTMELFQMWGMEKGLQAFAFPQERLHFAAIEKLGGTTLADRKQFSPSVTLSVAQDIVEKELREALSAYTDKVNFALGEEMTSFKSYPDHVEATFTSSEDERTRTAHWLVAADGANSPTRNAAGISMIGHPDLGSIINIYFTGAITPGGIAPSLGMKSMDMDIIGSFISMDGFERWCFHCHYDPAKETPTDFDDDRCREIVRRAANAPVGADIVVKSIRPWRMTAHVAKNFRHNNVFLIGDAAHAFPPSGGMGLNSGVQDAYNLAWKIAAVELGYGGDTLLDSYEEERRPIACLNTMQSIRNAITGDLLGLKSKSDIDRSLFDELEEAENKTVRSVAANFTDPVERKAWEGIEHGGNLGQELGFIYEGSSVINKDGDERPDIWIGKYIPNGCPGVRAPHFFLKRKDGIERSTIDLFDGQMTLVTLPAGATWRDALEKSGETQVRSVVLGEHYKADIDEFKAIYGVEDDGVVLVRPDGHIAFRARSSSASVNLPGAISNAYGRA